MPIWNQNLREDSKHSRRGFVGAAACPARQPGMFEWMKSTQGLTELRKSLPLEGCAPRSESEIYMTAGGSHTSTTVSRQKRDG